MTTPRPTHTRGRVAAMAAVALVALLTLSGCMKVEAHLEVHSDETVDGTMTIALAKSALSTMGTTFDAAIADSEPFEDDEVESSEPYEDDEYSGRVYTLKAMPLEEFGSETMSLTHADGLYTFSGVFEGSEGSEDLGDAPMGSITFAVTFPGEVTSSDGAIEGNTVTWTGAANRDLKMEAVAKDSPSGLAALPLPLLIGAGVAVLCIAGLVTAVMVRRRRAASAPVAGQWQTPATPFSAAPGMTGQAVPPQTWTPPTPVAEQPPTAADGSGNWRTGEPTRP